MKPSGGVGSALTVLLTLLALAGGAVWRITGGTGPAEGELGSTLAQNGEVDWSAAELLVGAQAVEGVEVIRDTLWIHVVASGTAEAFRSARVTTRRGGVVEEVRVRENAVVEGGEVLVRLDTLEAAMALAEARAQLQAARNRFAAGILAGGEIEDPGIREERKRNLRVRMGLVEAETAVRRAELEMELTRITAPFSGRVADLAAVRGAFLGSGAEVLTVVQLDPIRVQAEVLESDLPHLTEGRRGTVHFSALPDVRFDASVESVNPIVDVETRSGRVTLLVANEDGRLKPGMYATVRVDARALPDRILIPREAVVERGQPRREVVFVLRDADRMGRGRSEWRFVSTGRHNETQVEVVPREETDGVQPGEIVLVDGHHYLAHDVPVRLVPDLDGTAGGVEGEGGSR